MMVRWMKNFWTQNILSQKQIEIVEGKKEDTSLFSTWIMYILFEAAGGWILPVHGQQLARWELPNGFHT